MPLRIRLIPFAPAPVRRLARLAGALLALVAAAGRAGAQTPEQPVPGRAAGGTVSGLVVDAATGAPLGGATILLEPEAAGTLPPPRPGATPWSQTTRSTRSDAAGRYAFEGLGSGRYRLRIERAEYRAETVWVELRGEGNARVAVGLNVRPVELQPILVRAAAAQPFGRSMQVDTSPSSEAVSGNRVATTRARQQRYLSSDVQAVTAAEVTEGVTLAESDLFRAMHRLPGVSTRDDLSAELWTRGGRRDQTRVLWDGVPLWDPLHAYGAFAGVNSDAVGAAWLHPGVRPASIGEGAAGTVDLRSRRAAGDRRVRGSGELSLVSARAAAEQRVLDGRVGWAVAARRSYLDQITSAIDSIPAYAFADLSGRADLQLGDDWALEASAIGTSNRLEGDVFDLLRGLSNQWGDRAGRVTLDGPFRGGRLRQTAAASRWRYQSRPVPFDSAATVPSLARARPGTESRVAHFALLGEWTEPDPGRRRSAGYELVLRRTAYTGPEQRLGGRAAGEAVPIEPRASLGYAVAWAEQRWRPAPKLSVEGGMRLEVGERVAVEGVVRAAPRLVARWEAGPNTLVSAGLGRSFQGAQSIDALGPGPAAIFAANQRWLLAGRDQPPIRSDVATVGAERWLGQRWLATANGFARRTRGVRVADPAPGPALDEPIYLLGEGRAYGGEGSLRRLAGRWTAQTAYSYGVTETRVGAAWYPADQDRRHTLDATALARLSRSVRVGGAFTAMSGTPIRRYRLGEFRCDSVGCRTIKDAQLGPAAEARGPRYASLDLLADWTWRVRGVRAGAFLQLQNALGRDNQVTYLGTCDVVDQGACAGGIAPRDEFLRGLGRVPLLGLRLAF
jgi:hypothetical protein